MTDYLASLVPSQRDMSEQAERLKKRAMQFAHDVCALIQQIPTAEPGPTVRQQLAKCSTSVAFNYRAACRARSHAEFTAKVGLIDKARELRAIFAASAATARRKQRKKRG